MASLFEAFDGIESSIDRLAIGDDLQVALPCNRIRLVYRDLNSRAASPPLRRVRRKTKKTKPVQSSPTPTNGTEDGMVRIVRNQPDLTLFPMGCLKVFSSSHTHMNTIHENTLLEHSTSDFEGFRVNTMKS